MASSYTPPSSSAIKTKQDEDDALRLLIAQRRLYSKSKRWLGLRWLGMVVIGIGAPVVAVIWPSLAVTAGAVAGFWLFLGRTALLARQEALAERGAAVQEQFDFLVFGMPQVTNRSVLPQLEDIAALAGADSELRKVARTEKLLGWYEIDPTDDGVTSVAICQRANASYTHRLIRMTSTVYQVLVGVWAIFLLILSSLADLSLGRFLLGVALPVLPAFLDAVEYVGSVRRSSTDKADLASLIEEHLTGLKGPVNPEDLLAWQTQIFELRRSAPDVPDVLYKLTRKRNERAMKSAAQQLSEKAKRQKL